MRGMHRGALAATAAVTIAVTAAIATGPFPPGASAPAATVAPTPSAADLDAREAAVLARANAVRRSVDALEADEPASIGSAALEPVAAAPPPVSVTPAPPVTSSASS